MVSVSTDRAAVEQLAVGAFGLGYSPRTAVELSAGLLTGVEHDTAPTVASQHLGGPVASWCEVSPGSIRLRTGVVPGWELFDRADGEYWAELAALPAELALEPVKISTEHRRILERRDAKRRCAHRRGTVTVWSKQSQRNMTRRMATLDWSDVFRSSDEFTAGMVTLTYPGDWERYAPDGATCAGHLDQFFARFRSDIERPRMFWKREFQGRGAPHFHLHGRLPVGDVRRRWRVRAGGGRWGTAVSQPMSFYQWCSETWADIVWPRVRGRLEGPATLDHPLRYPDDVPARVDFLRAGTGVDYSTAQDFSDPVRLAIYFSKHSAGGISGPKAYQHRLPKSWRPVRNSEIPGRLHGPCTLEHPLRFPDDRTSCGRWWGYRGLRPCTAEVEVDRADAVELVRLLRSYVASQGRTVKTRARRGVNTCTGEIRSRPTRRRYRVRSLRRQAPGGFVLVNNGPALLAEFARHVNAHNVGCVERDWRLRGPLP